MSDKKVLVVGAGVIGMSTALTLAKAGHKVTIWAKDLPADTTSAVAGAFWYPYLCNPKEKALAWSKFTHEYCMPLADDQNTGVLLITMYEYFDELTPEPWWRSAVGMFEHVPITELPDGYKDGHKVDLLVMDTTKFLPWLQDQLQHAGVQIIQREISSFAEIPEDFEVIINCTGLGSKELCHDDRIYPVRGQVVKIKSNGFDKVLADDSAHNNLAYIIPRTNDIVLGGTAQVNDWRLGIDPRDTTEILNKAALLSPLFKNVSVIEEKVGLRPTRDEIRLEREVIDDRIVIHNYGHGGGGYTLAWGCALSVLDLVNTN